MKIITGGVTAPIGFRAAGMYCGIKKKQKKQLDLALLVSEQEGPVAGVFTTNQVVAAPVVLDRLHLKKGIGRAILVNSGNANACTGPTECEWPRRWRSWLPRPSAVRPILSSSDRPA
jgi:glutamate N-acetyltransferase/amino-acid N-acetyltransferase